MHDSETDPDDLWLVMRWSEPPHSHGGAAWWTGDGWTVDRPTAAMMHRTDAERAADDWTSWARSKGRPEQYRAEPMQGRPQ